MLLSFLGVVKLAFAGAGTCSAFLLTLSDFPTEKVFCFKSLAAAAVSPVPY